MSRPMKIQSIWLFPTCHLDLQRFRPPSGTIHALAALIDRLGAVKLLGIIGGQMTVVAPRH